MANRDQQIRQQLQTAGITVTGLVIDDRGSVISIKGTVGDESEKRRAEEAIERGTGTKVANHLQTRVASSAGTTGLGAGNATAGQGQRYVVKSGDTLSKIAKHFYGNAQDWKKIHAANKDKVPNPDLIHPGQELTIPSA